MACIWSARATRRRSGSASMMPTSAAPAAQSRRIEDPQADAGAPHHVPELVGRSPRSDPVAEHADVDAARGCADEGVGEPLADLVGAQDVALDGDRMSGRVNQLEHLVE